MLVLGVRQESGEAIRTRGQPVFVLEVAGQVMLQLEPLVTHGAHKLLLLVVGLHVDHQPRLAEVGLAAHGAGVRCPVLVMSHHVTPVLDIGGERRGAKLTHDRSRVVILAPLD